MAASASNKHSFLNKLTIAIHGQDSAFLKNFLLQNKDLFRYSDIVVSKLHSSYIIKMDFLDRPLKWGWFMCEFPWINLQANQRKPEYEVLEWDRFEITGPDLFDEVDSVDNI